MTGWRIAYKSFLFCWALLAFVLISLFWRLWTKDMVRRRHHYTHTVSFFSRLALLLMNFRVQVIHPPPKDSSFLLIGNHLGMLDILVLAAHHPSLFITSVDMRETPGLGFLTEMGGCLYVERRNRLNIISEIEQIRETLRQKFTVTLYPEGTSGNGEMVLPFKKSLLTAVVGTDVPLLPVVINYRKVNGEKMSSKWREHVFWYGDHTFFPAMKRIFSVQSVDVDLEFCDEIDVHSEEQRRQIASQLQHIISSKFTPIVGPVDCPG
jgi:1-acyl-sn-glycerol-3-phosphate acyltransferase